MKTRPYAVAALVTVLLAFSEVRAQALLQWNTFGNTGLETTEPSVFNHVNIIPSDLTLGAGVTPTKTVPAANSANRFGGIGWFDSGDSSPTTLAESISGNDYIQFVVTPTAGSSFTPTQFVFSWAVGSVTLPATSPVNLALRSSADAFGANLATGGVSSAGTTQLTLDFGGLVDLTTATTFRLYGYGGTGPGSSGAFRTSVSAVNVQLNGTVGVSAIPEPSTYAAIFGGIALVGASIVRRRRSA